MAAAPPCRLHDAYYMRSMFVFGTQLHVLHAAAHTSTGSQGSLARVIGVSSLGILECIFHNSIKRLLLGNIQLIALPPSIDRGTWYAEL